MSYRTLAGQLVNLQKENPLARAVTATKTVWDVGLRLNCGRVVCLRTHLPTGFPERAAPHMQIVLPANLQSHAQHPWLDPQLRVVGLRALNAWGKTRNPMIGPILKLATAHFIKNPPVLVPLNSPQYGYGAARGAVRGRPTQQYPRGQPASQYPRGRPTQQYPRGQPTQQYPRGQPTQQYARGHQRPPAYRPRPVAQPKPKPPPQLKLLELSSMSKSVLKLLRDELKAAEGDSILVPDLLRWGLREVSQKHDKHVEVVGQNAKIAAENLKSSGEQQALQSQLTALQAQVREKHAAYAKAKHELIALKQTMTPVYAIDRVTESVDELDSKCSAMAEDFVYDDMELKEFESEFLKTRELYHKRNAMLELQGPVS